MSKLGRCLSIVSGVARPLVLLLLLPGENVLPGGVLFAQASGQQLNLVWEKVPGAAGYKITIENQDGLTVLDVSSLDNKITLTLPDGKYKAKIGVLNKFQKVQYWASQRLLEIDRNYQPAISKVDPPALMAKSGRQKIELEGKNFLADTKVSIVSGKKTLALSEVEADKDTMKLVIDLTAAEPGAYDIIVNNKELYSFESKGALKITPYVPPKIDKADVWGSMWRSAVLPGWGQDYQSRGASSLIFFGGFVASAMLASHSYLDTRRQNDAYKGNVTTLLLVGLLSSPSTRAQFTAVSFSETDSARRRSMSAAERTNRYVTIAALWYVAGLGETWWFRSSSPDITVGIAPTPSGLGVGIRLPF